MYLLPRGGADEDELGEELRASNGGEDADHSGNRVADVRATIDAERIEDVEEIIDVRVERSVATEIEVVRVDRSGADEVVEDDTVVTDEEWQNAIPRGLIGAEAVSED